MLYRADPFQFYDKVIFWGPAVVLYWVQLSNLTVRLRPEQAMKEEPFFRAHQPGTSIKGRQIVIHILDLQPVL